MPGSNDVRVAKYAASLVLAGMAPVVVFSGARGRLTEDWPETEADTFAKVALAEGVARDKIIIENRATNTGENIAFTRALLRERGVLDAEGRLPAGGSIIVVQKPYMIMRSYASWLAQWPELNGGGGGGGGGGGAPGAEPTNSRLMVASPPELNYANYPADGIIARDELVSVMAGDLQRVFLYPRLGYQVRVEIPDAIWKALAQLVGLGFTSHLAKR